MKKTWATGLATLALALLPFAAAARPASAATFPANCSSEFSGLSTFHFGARSCLDWTGVEGMLGQAQVLFDTAPGHFAPSHVTHCTLYIELLSSYGSKSDVSEDCTARARQGLEYISGGYRWGLGRRAGDKYTQYAWVEVRTGSGIYNSRGQAAKVSVFKPS